MRVPSPNGWGMLFRTVTQKWGYRHRLQFFDQLIDLELRQLINQVSYAEPEALFEQGILETTLKLREKLRGYFLDVDFKVCSKSLTYFFRFIL